MNSENGGGGGSSSKCPVQHGGAGASTDNKNEESSSTSSSFWGSFWKTTTLTTTTPAMSSTESSNLSSASSCPVATTQHGAAAVASLEEAARHAQTPQPDQKLPLATNRQISSIPRDTFASQSSQLPNHQHHTEASKDTSNNNNNKWVYPSEQQLYNAMRRKGWQNIPEDSIPTVLQIHNHINERTWRQIQEWEGTSEIVLTKFQGRPRDLSPKAFVLSKLLRIREAPFDRHDWYVQQQQQQQHQQPTLLLQQQQQQQQQQRYVIDYYYLPHPVDPVNLPPIPYVDARPALDHPRALWLRGKRFLRDAFPGIVEYSSMPQVGKKESHNTSAAAKK